MRKATDTLRRAAELRHAFDAAFAEPAGARAADTQDILLIQMGNETYGLRLAEIRGVHVDRRITPVPGPLPELLGIAGLRGNIVPVYGLGPLLGHPAAVAPRWLVLARREPMALAFERFIGHRRIPASGGSQAPPPSRAHAYVSTAVQIDERWIPLVDVPSILENIGRRARSGASS